MGSGDVSPITISKGRSQRLLFYVHPPKKGSGDRQEDSCEGKNVEHAKAEAEEGQQGAGVGGMTDIAVGAGGDEFVILGDGDVDGEEAAEVDDGDPAHNRSEHEEDNADDVEGLRMRQPSLRQRGPEKKAREDAEGNYRPEKRQGEAILSVVGDL